MGGLDEFAAQARALAARAEASLARDVAEAGAKELLAAMFTVTPVKTGKLRSTETVQAVSGGGDFAVALVGPDIIYDKFRNDGGTIHVRNAKVLTDGTSFFGKQVTQRGAHYMERAEEEGRPLIAAMAAIVVDEFIRL
jgi:hypothetical protein